MLDTCIYMLDTNLYSVTGRLPVNADKAVVLNVTRSTGVSWAWNTWEHPGMLRAPRAAWRKPGSLIESVCHCSGCTVGRERDHGSLGKAHGCTNRHGPEQDLLPLHTGWRKKAAPQLWRCSASLLELGFEELLRVTAYTLRCGRLAAIF